MRGIWFGILLIAVLLSTNGIADKRERDSTFSSCEWVEEGHVSHHWLEYYICNAEVVGAVRNRKNATGLDEDDKFWQAERPLDHIIGTFTSKQAAKQRLIQQR